MKIKSDYTIFKNQSHVGWNKAIAPVKTIEGGDVVTFRPLIHLEFKSVHIQPYPMSLLWIFQK